MSPLLIAADPVGDVKNARKADSGRGMAVEDRQVPEAVCEADQTAEIGRSQHARNPGQLP